MVPSAWAHMQGLCFSFEWGHGEDGKGEIGGNIEHEVLVEL